MPLSERAAYLRQDLWNTYGSYSNAFVMSFEPRKAALRISNWVPNTYVYTSDLEAVEELGIPISDKIKKEYEEFFKLRGK